MKGLVLQMGDYFMDRALHCCWLLHSGQHLILWWWQEISFPFSERLWYFFSFLQVLLSCIGAFCFLNQSEQERMDLQVSKQLLRTCFERFLDNKADLAQSPVTRLKDASLSWRSLCFLMTTHTHASNHDWACVYLLPKMFSIGKVKLLKGLQLLLRTVVFVCAPHSVECLLLLSAFSILAVPTLHS